MTKGEDEMDRSADLRLDVVSQAPPGLDTDRMTAEEIRALLREGYDDMIAGRVRDAPEAFREMRLG